MAAAEIACAYRAAPLAPPDAVDAYMRAVVAFARSVPYRVVDVEPYGSAAEMAHRVRADGVLQVWSGASDGLVWTAWANWAARAGHDYYDHLDGLRGSLAVPFDFDGEVAACTRACARWPALAPLLRSEILGQAACFVVDGVFPTTQRVGWLL